MYYQPAIKEIGYWIMFSAFHLLIFWLLTLPAPIPDEEKKITYIFIFTLLCA